MSTTFESGLENSTIMNSVRARNNSNKLTSSHGYCDSNASNHETHHAAAASENEKNK